jgi:nucleoporin NUP82
LKSHISKAREVANRIKAITGDDAPPGEEVVDANQKVETRIEAAKLKQQELNKRIDEMRKKASRGSSRELSDKEKAWIDEVQILNNKIMPQEDAKDSTEPWARYEKVKALKKDLLEQVQNLEVVDEGVATPNVKVPSEIRKAKMTQVMGLLDRETALVEAAKSRLERLSLS